MRPARFRRILATVAVASLTLGLSACATGFGAPTNQQYQAGIGADVRGTDVQVLGALLVTDENGGATVSATLLNNSGDTQRLTSLTLTDTNGETIDVSSTMADALEIGKGERRTLGAVDDDNEQFGSKVYTASDVDAGYYYTLTLTFDGAGQIELQIPSVERTAMYDSVVEAPTTDEPEQQG